RLREDEEHLQRRLGVEPLLEEHEDVERDHGDAEREVPHAAEDQQADVDHPQGGGDPFDDQQCLTVEKHLSAPPPMRRRRSRPARPPRAPLPGVLSARDGPPSASAPWRGRYPPCRLRSRRETWCRGG